MKILILAGIIAVAVIWPCLRMSGECAREEENGKAD